MSFDFDVWWGRKKRADRESRRERLNANCPHCDAVVLDELEESAYDSGGYGLQSTTVFECPHCGVDVDFELRWVTELSWAKPIVEEEK